MKSDEFKLPLIAKGYKQPLTTIQT